MVHGRTSASRARYLVEAPLRRRRLVVVPAVVASLAAASLTLLLPARYRAAALVQVEWIGADEGLPGLRQRVTETAVLERVVAEAAPYAAARGASAPAAVQVERLRSDLRVRPMSARSFVVEFEHADPAMASLVPNVLARALVERADATRRVRFEILRLAAPPAAPKSSDPVWFGFAGAGFGLLLGLTAALLAEHRDQRVKGPEDLEQILEVPLLATLPEVRVRAKRRSGDAGL